MCLRLSIFFHSEFSFTLFLRKKKKLHLFPFCTIGKKSIVYLGIIMFLLSVYLKILNDSFVLAKSYCCESVWINFFKGPDFQCTIHVYLAVCLSEPCIHYTQKSNIVHHGVLCNYSVLVVSLHSNSCICPFALHCVWLYLRGLSLTRYHRLIQNSCNRK